MAVTTTSTTAVNSVGQHNNYHDSKSSPELTTKSSLVKGNGTSDGQSVIRAARAAYEQKIEGTIGLSSTKKNATANMHLNSGEISKPAQELQTNSTLETDKKLTGLPHVESESKVSPGDGPEVFLGGSCNPTTWRADVAIPTLNKLGISFYNPQVSDWTPDLIELEHRAKEKARVLFFVMDSETRATAGAIEAANIAGSNTKQLVLVLHPYKPNQKILNETVSKQ